MECCQRYDLRGSPRGGGRKAWYQTIAEAGGSNTGRHRFGCQLGQDYAFPVRLIPIRKGGDGENLSSGTSFSRISRRSDLGRRRRSVLKQTTGDCFLQGWVLVLHTTWGHTQALIPWARTKP